jgi:hypothetical protein
MNPRVSNRRQGYARRRVSNARDLDLLQRRYQTSFMSPCGSNSSRSGPCALGGRPKRTCGSRFGLGRRLQTGTRCWARYWRYWATWPDDTGKAHVHGLIAAIGVNNVQRGVSPARVCKPDASQVLQTSQLHSRRRAAACVPPSLPPKLLRSGLCKTGRSMSSSVSTTLVYTHTQT